MVIEPVDSRQREIALSVGAWRSYTAGHWWTDAHVAVRCRERFAGAQLELICGAVNPGGCSTDCVEDELATCRRLTEESSRPDTDIKRAIRDLLKVANQATQPITVSPDVIVLPDRFGAFRVRPVAGSDARIGVQNRYVVLIEREAAPDEWRVVSTPTVTIAARVVVAFRGGQVVGAVVPILIPETAAIDARGRRVDYSEVV